MRFCVVYAKYGRTFIDAKSFEDAEEIAKHLSQDNVRWDSKGEIVHVNKVNGEVLRRKELGIIWK